MILRGIQYLSTEDNSSFEQALEEAAKRNGQLCFVVRSLSPGVNYGINNTKLRLWLLNSGGTGRSFYNKHYRDKNYLLCVAPHWFIDFHLGIHSN